MGAKLAAGSDVVAGVSGAGVGGVGNPGFQVTGKGVGDGGTKFRQSTLNTAADASGKHVRSDEAMEVQVGQTDSTEVFPLRCCNAAAQHDARTIEGI